MAPPLIALVLLGLSTLGESHAETASADQLLTQFKGTRVFWQQFEIAKEIVALHDTSVLPKLEGELKNEDRHLRGNAAFIFASLGDDRGFEVIQAMVADRSARPEGQGIPGVAGDGHYRVEQQIAADRYYAVHLLGDLKDPRAVPILVPLLRDDEVDSIVPWALGEIGNKRADTPLIAMLGDKDPSLRVLAIDALEMLGAKVALPRLHELLNDNTKSNFDGQVSVAAAAREAIAKLETAR